ncbi:MAG: cysteine synthase A [Candidatus Izimaplasma sp.]|nr:cysteine synthase A [Candidatus Izimaplasma bacterium]
MIYQNIYDTIGNTPIIDISHLTNKNAANLYVKLEWFNPGGSVKDRIAINMIDVAEKAGHITPGDTIVEPTSGNTGIGIAMVAAAKGYKAILIMPDSLSIERRKVLKGYGAELILTPADKGMKESIHIAEKLVNKHGYFMPMQFDNKNNPLAHELYTAKEIIKDLPKITHFIAGVGTGGTITGVGRALKGYNKSIQIIAVEPETSAVISGEEAGKHTIQGIGAGFIPSILDTQVIDDVMTVNDEKSYDMARQLAKENGLFVGISSGANILAAINLANSLTQDDIVLTVSASNAERYLSTTLFERP